MRTAEKHRLRRDPYAYLEELCRGSDTAIVRLPWGGWCVRDTELGQTVLRSADFHDGMSAFFGGLLPTRETQVAVGHAVRDFLRANLREFRDMLRTVTADLPVTTAWPATGIELVHRCLTTLLLHPDTPPHAREALERAVHGGVVLRPPRVWRRAHAELLRGTVVIALTEQVRRRRAHPAATSRDMLGAVVDACPRALTDRAVAEVFLLLLRAIVAPVGISLAWSVLLVGRRHTSDAPWPWPADDIVREALRQRPVVWMVGRAVPRPMDIGGIRLRAGEILSVSPYLLHHDPRHWTDPHAFRPERWARPDGRGPYAPFGAGPFTCAGAAVAQVLTTEAFTALTDRVRLTMSQDDTRPTPLLVDGACPRPFTVNRTLRERTNRNTPEGGERPCSDASSAPLRPASGGGGSATR